MPSIAVGSAEPDRIYVGGQQVDRIYLGRQIVWPSFDTPSGPKGCWVPVFQSFAGTPPGGHSSLCRDDLGTVGDVTSIATYTENFSQYHGFDGIVHAAGYGEVDEPPLQDDAVLAADRLTTLRIERDHAGFPFGPLTLRVRRGNGNSGGVRQFTDDFYNDGYMALFCVADVGSAGRIVIIKPSFGTRSAETTLAMTTAQMTENQDILSHLSSINLFYPPSWIDGEPELTNAPFITSIIDPNAINQYRGLAFFNNLDALGDLVFVEGYDADGVTPAPAVFYGRDWTTYGLGEVARFLLGLARAQSIGAENDVYTLYDSSDTDASDLVTGDAEIAEGITVSRIRYNREDRRLILNRSGSGNFRNWAIGDGAGKSLFVAARGDIMELPFVATSEYEGDANPTTETGGAGFFRWDLRTITPGASAMHQHLLDYGDGDGYQLLFVVADRGTVNAV